MIFFFFFFTYFPFRGRCRKLIYLHQSPDSYPYTLSLVMIIQYSIIYSTVIICRNDLKVCSAIRLDIALISPYDLLFVFFFVLDTGNSFTFIKVPIVIHVL